MNRFDEYYDIRQAQIDEISDIMCFIGQYWKKGHILSVNRDFFEYEMVINNQVNFVIARVKTTGVIDGVLGYLPCSSDKKQLDAWGVIWKTKDDALPMLGIELKKRFFLITGARTDLGVGANLSTSVPLLGRILHYYTARMKHYYRLNDLNNYKIAHIKRKKIPKCEHKTGAEFLELKEAKDLKAFFDFKLMCNQLPYKDFWYFERRFYNHPIYSYKVWGINDGIKKAFMVTRIHEYNNSYSISIVDYAGEQTLFPSCGMFFDELMRENGYEYVDFYFEGFDEEVVLTAGFTEVEENDENIIPTYFKPYEAKNIDIYVVSSDNKSKYVFFKADGDQDRPS